MTAPGADAPIVEARSMTRVLPGAVPVTLVRDVDLKIGTGELVAITGPSGSGKSSLLYLLGLLDRPSEGRLTISGVDSGALDEGERARLRLETLGFVFQFHFLLPEFTALQNVAIPMRKLGALPAGEIRGRAATILEDLDLGRHLDKRPDQLSGGERQRVAVARALANDPPLILADEPTGSLDTRNARNVFDILKSLVRARGKTVIAVTHDAGLAAETDRRLSMLDGRVVSDG